MKRILKSGPFWFAFAAAVFLVVGVVSTVFFWGWLHPKDSQTASNSETVRNLGLLIGGVLAFVFALWRGWVAERQAATAQRQVEIALQQAATAQHQAEIARQQASTSERGLLNERYQKGAEMLGSDVLSVRLGGIYALQHLAEDHPDQYHVQIMRLFCAFARYPSADKTIPDGPNAKVREDVQAVMEAIEARYDRHIQIELESWYLPDLREVKLRLAGLVEANLQGADLRHSMLARSSMNRANLSNVKFFKADLSNADLTDANLVGAILAGADLTSANLSGTKLSLAGCELPAIGLTQAQLDRAQADPVNPPHLEGVVDAETGKPLVWRGGPLKDVADGDR